MCVLAAVVVVLVACGGEPDQTLGSNNILVGNATLTCGQACAAQGQCGDSLERGKVILLSSFGPATSGHDIAAQENTPVVINSSQQLPVVRLRTNEQLPMNFYQVTVPERGVAWVAGWCIAGGP
ncbi:MAG: hypothetical protein L0332_29755 [Chloroflexi bacterium]|nr:hypothetical protein [Chloroflexota bacterium]MCI0645193.1 hypothetical protein [Chloroflexota bacterium]MCI0730886.1 hypothetical protein [Chloroflexota bacterium]